MAEVAPAPRSAPGTSSVAFAVALETVRVLAIAALGMDNRVPFNDEFLIKNGGLGRRFCDGFFWFSTGGLAILAGEALAPRSA